jgi:RNA polymerase sigma-70 factor (ECF subfamily)
MTRSGIITKLLGDLHGGVKEAESELMPLIYTQLRRVAAHHFGRERDGHTLGPTDVVHETYLRLIQPGSGPWKSREHFFATASRTMRRILVDYARAHHAGKRGGRQSRVDLDEVVAYLPEPPTILLDLDRALKRLARHSRRHSRIVELRYFTGLTIRETAAVLHVSATVVKEDWSFAIAWLQRDLREVP